MRLQSFDILQRETKLVFYTNAWFTPKIPQKLFHMQLIYTQKLKRAML